MNPLRKRLSKFIAANLALGFLLFAFMYWNESMSVPRWAENPVRDLYNVIFGLTLPMQSVAEIFRDRDSHQFPVQYRFFAYVFSPLLVATLVALYWTARKRRHEARVRTQGTDLSRRQFMIRASDATIGCGAIAIGGYSTFFEPWGISVVRYDAPIAGLPKKMEGYTIAQISDTHYGPFVPLSHVENAIRVANSLNPDFTVLTGDYVHRSPRAIELGVGAMVAVKAKHGVAAVLGNHDHWESAEDCHRVFSALKIPMLDNARTFLSPEGLCDSTKPGEGICLAGVGDLWTDIVSTRDALHGVDPELPRILLSHNPDVAENEAIHERIDLMISGHTHGGQISLPFKGPLVVPSAYGVKYAGGWCAGPRFPVVVSRGVGMAVMPYRFRVPPEIVLITLREVRS